MNLIFFPKYTEKGPSSRYRIYQYLKYFESSKIKVFPFFDEEYETGMSFKSLKGIQYVIRSYCKRIYNMIRLNNDDLVFVQYEFTQYLPFNFLFFAIWRIKYIVDFDDAVFHDYDQHKNRLVRFVYSNKIKNVIKHAEFVITGSPYLSAYASTFNTNVLEIPTSVNISKYDIVQRNNINTKFIIGWIGSKTTTKNLISLIPSFEYLKEHNYDFEISCIGFNEDLKDKFEHLPLKIIKWDARTEVEEISNFTVGIMPLDDNLFNKGKCAFKLIQYMASGIPTISTPLEANLKVNRGNHNLFASSTEEWIDCFKKVYSDIDYFKKIGMDNRMIVEEFYSIQSNYKKYIELFNKMNEK